MSNAEEQHPAEIVAPPMGVGGPSSYSFSVEQWQLQTPMLPPAMLREYEELMPGFSERFVVAWEKQTDHRQSLERTVVATQSTTQLRGQRYTLALGSLALLVAGALGVSGHEGSAIAVAGMDFVSIGGAFVYSKYKDGKDLKAKAEEVPETPKPERVHQAQLPKGRVTEPRPRQRQKKKRR